MSIFIQAAPAQKLSKWRDVLFWKTPVLHTLIKLLLFRTDEPKIGLNYIQANPLLTMDNASKTCLAKMSSAK